MNFFFHNTITINGENYSSISLQENAHLVSQDTTHEYFDFWNFIKNWLDESKDYIEVKTSGSTGKPKIIKHKKERMLASAKMTCDFFGLNDRHKVLLCLSPSHIGGMMMVVRALYTGMSLEVVKPSSNPLFNLDEEIDF
ncbi:MAG: AMP-binding protein, partial [Chitinophagales bacterium]